MRPPDDTIHDAVEAAADTTPLAVPMRTPAHATPADRRLVFGIPATVTRKGGQVGYLGVKPA
jgi:hypothetical protein